MLEMRRPDDDNSGLDDRIGFADTFRYVHRWAGLLLAGALLGGVVGAIYAAMAEATYVASARLLLERPRAMSSAGDPGLVQFTLDTAQIESQIQVILSESTTRRVVRELGLASDAEFTSPDSSIFQGLVREVRSVLSGEPSGAEIRSRAGADGKVAQSPSSARLDYVLAVMNGRLGARRIGQSYAIELSFWSHDADKSSRIANSVAAAYIGNQLQLRAAAAESGTELIAKKLEELRTNVAEAQKAVRTGVIDVHTFPSSDVRVITAASPPLGKSWPRTNLMIALGSLIGLLSALMVSFVLQRRQSEFDQL